MPLNLESCLISLSQIGKLQSLLKRKNYLDDEQLYAHLNCQYQQSLYQTTLKIHSADVHDIEYINLNEHE